MTHPRRGEVWWVSFDPSIGGEIQKTRPAIIMSNDMANTVLNRVVVIPVSSQISKIYPSEALITVNGQPRKAMADQIATASKRRLTTKLGIVSRSDMAEVEHVLLFHLAITN
jgi:mRNA interferase MazF